jgi:nitroreductase
MAELLQEIEIRRAKRALSEEQVPAEVVQRMMTAATYAPSCFNNQPWRFVVINEEPALEQVKDALPDANYWAKKSPLLVLAVTKPDLDCQLKDRREYALFDVGLATQNLMLQAVKEGLIAHPIAGFKPTKLKEAFGIPEDYIVIAVIVLGFPGDESHLNDKHLEAEHSERSRKSESQVIMYNRWA